MDEEKKVEVSKEVVKEKESKESKDRYALVEVTTETDLAIKDNKTDKVFTTDGLLLEILNKVDKIERALA